MPQPLCEGCCATGAAGIDFFATCCEMVACICAPGGTDAARGRASLSADLRFIEAMMHEKTADLRLR